MKKYKVKLKSHNDLDGLGENVLLSLVPEIDLHYENHSYVTIDDSTRKFIEERKYLKYDEVFFTDISLSEEVANMIDNLPIEERINFKLIDHHVPNSDWMKKYDWCLIQKDKNGILQCGTSLFYEELISLCEKMDFKEGLKNLKKDITISFVESVRLYDTWDWTIVEQDVLNKYNPEKMNMLYYLLGGKRFIKQMKEKLLTMSGDEIIFNELEAMILDIDIENKERYFKKKLKEMTIKENQGYNMGFVFAENYISDLGTYIMENTNCLIDCVMIITPPAKGSLRTNRDDVNVCEIAKLYGGGGHPKASGFPVTPELLKTFI